MAPTLHAQGLGQHACASQACATMPRMMLWPCVSAGGWRRSAARTTHSSSSPASSTSWTPRCFLSQLLSSLWKLVVSLSLSVTGCCPPVQRRFTSACCAGRTGGAGRVRQGVVAAAGRSRAGRAPAGPQRLGAGGVPGAGKRAGRLAAGWPPHAAAPRAQVWTVYWWTCCAAITENKTPSQDQHLLPEHAAMRAG